MPGKFTDKETQLIEFLIKGGELTKDIDKSVLGAGFDTLNKRLYAIMDKIRWHKVDHEFLIRCGLADGEITIEPDPRKVGRNRDKK